MRHNLFKVIAKTTLPLLKNYFFKTLIDMFHDFYGWLQIFRMHCIWFVHRGYVKTYFWKLLVRIKRQWSTAAAIYFQKLSRNFVLKQSGQKTIDSAIRCYKFDKDFEFYKIVFLLMKVNITSGRMVKKNYGGT